MRRPSSPLRTRPRLCAVAEGWLWGLASVLVLGAFGCTSADEDTTPGPNTHGDAGHTAAGGEGATAGGGGGGAGGEAGRGGEPWLPVESDWCVDEGWVGFDEHTCFYAPEPLDPSVGLLVFLHGMLPPDGSPETMQWIVRQAADSHGFVALFPRGRPGLCAWDPSVEDWFCWPTRRETVDDETSSFTEQWDAASAVLEGVLEVSFEARYVLGFSNGGYFASYIGLEGLWPVAGAGLVGAGRSYVDETLLWDEQPPFYIAVGELESVEVQQSAQNLAYVLSLHGWPYDYVVHAGRGHTIQVDDLDSAWALWTGP